VEFHGQFAGESPDFKIFKTEMSHDNAKREAKRAKRNAPSVTCRLPLCALRLPLCAYRRPMGG
jgi:hypothetical protein